MCCPIDPFSVSVLISTARLPPLLAAWAGSRPSRQLGGEAERLRPPALRGARLRSVGWYTLMTRDKPRTPVDDAPSQRACCLREPAVCGPLPRPFSLSRAISSALAAPAGRWAARPVPHDARNQRGVAATNFTQSHDEALVPPGGRAPITGWFRGQRSAPTTRLMQSCRSAPCASGAWPPPRHPRSSLPRCS